MVSNKIKFFDLLRIAVVVAAVLLNITYTSDPVSVIIHHLRGHGCRVCPGQCWDNYLLITATNCNIVTADHWSTHQTWPVARLTNELMIRIWSRCPELFVFSARGGVCFTALSADTDEVSATMRTNGRWSGRWAEVSWWAGWWLHVFICGWLISCPHSDIFGTFRCLTPAQLLGTR